MPSFDVSMRMNALARTCAQLMPALRAVFYTGVSIKTNFFFFFLLNITI